MAAQKCPVCDWRIDDHGQAVEIDGKVVTVCCDECVAKLRAEPAKYAKAT